MPLRILIADDEPLARQRLRTLLFVVGLLMVAFLLGLALLLWRMMRAPHATGDVFKTFMIAYLSWRFVIDFFKEDATFCKISAIQWTCLAVLLVYRPHLARVTKALLGLPSNEIQNDPAARAVATEV